MQSTEGELFIKRIRFKELDKYMISVHRKDWITNKYLFIAIESVRAIAAKIKPINPKS